MISRTFGSFFSSEYSGNLRKQQKVRNEQPKRKEKKRKEKNCKKWLTWGKGNADWSEAESS